MKRPTPAINTTADFIALEERLYLWDVEIDGVWLWPALREEVMVTLNTLRDSVVRTKPSPLQVVKPHLWPMHAKTLRFLSQKRQRNGPYDALFVHWTEDYIYSEFYGRLSQPLLLESSLFGRFDRTNWDHPDRDLLLHDTLKIMGRAHQAFTRLPAAHRQTISEFCQHVADHFHLPDASNRFVAMVTAHVMRYRFLKPIITRRIVPHLTNRIAFVAVAAYMASKAALTQVLHEANFTVVEAQHGIINKDHIAYTLPQKSISQVDHPARLYLPDHLLTFGPYWHANAQIPSEKIVVGFPRLTSKLDLLLSNDNPDDKTILLVSQWTITKRLVDLAVQLAAQLPTYHIIYKLHPVEVNMPDMLAPLANIANIEVIGLANIHEVIARARVVVGYNSTVLFEALAFPERRLFILENDEMPPEMGQFFQNVDELAAGIATGNDGYPSLQPDDVWADTPQARIIAYMRQLGLNVND